MFTSTYRMEHVPRCFDQSSLDPPRLAACFVRLPVFSFPNNEFDEITEAGVWAEPGSQALARLSDPMISIGAMIGNRQRIERLRERSVFPP